MRRKLVTVLAACSIAVAGSLVASPASAASTGGYQICYGGKKIGAQVTGHGTLQVSAGGKSTATYATPPGSTLRVYGNGSTGTWTASASTLRSASGFCY